MAMMNANELPAVMTGGVNAFADQVVVLRDGRVAGHGPPLEVLTPIFIEEVFGVRAHVGPHPITGRPHIAVASPNPWSRS
ncbi:hypothetical protein ACFOY2_28040 [Nonomuraea purpurea]|uniref:ABC transporter ATP-binding protein n=1 Tax=Nonomuraea purpurea TaxID=1849276 RepID=A0ABV8GE63_9ACTN